MWNIKQLIHKLQTAPFNKCTNIWQVTLLPNELNTVSVIIVFKSTVRTTTEIVYMVTRQVAAAG